MSRSEEMLVIFGFLDERMVQKRRRMGLMEGGGGESERRTCSWFVKWGGRWDRGVIATGAEWYCQFGSCERDMLFSPFNYCRIDLLRVQ